MGRPFATELSNLSKTVATVNLLNLGHLPNLINSASLSPVFLIGTGGSLSAAEFAKRLFDQRGTIAQVVTPLEFLQSRAISRNSSAFIFSAGGNNKDVLAALEAAIEREMTRVVIVCASRKSKLANMATNFDRASVFAFDLPSGRDGYLATNSLIATCVILARAFNHIKLFDSNVDALLKEGRESFDAFTNRRLNYFVLLFSGWARPAAVDMESKLSEAGLAASMLADYRHFAHGRHNWFDKHGTCTGIVAYSTPEDERLSKATLKSLPASILAHRFHASETGPKVGLEFLLKTFGFIAELGRARQIDPGRPGVPDYGSRIYSLGPRTGATGAKLHKDSVLTTAADRKRFAAGLPENNRIIYENACQKFLKRLNTTRFRGLILDFDGTVIPTHLREGPIPTAIAEPLVRLLRAKINVYLATGRGDSVNKLLKATFPIDVWKKLHIAYLNGSFCLSLSECDKFSNYIVPIKELVLLEQRFKSNPILPDLAEIKNKGQQVSLLPRAGVSVRGLTTILQEEFAKSPCQSARMVISSHSIDFICESVSKLKCVEIAQQQSSGEVLAIGDCGAYPGNDFELLQHPFSLSVDTVSTDLKTCWNLLPKGLSHTSGTAAYLSSLKISDQVFELKID